MTSRFARWRKSTRSGPQADCVEVAVRDDRTTVGVRDSKAPAGAVLSVPLPAWACFVGEVKRGGFGRP
ncbi:MAG: DUF397 domain-containing protein [Dactylosporangium sp.]|nr:DUF397 domain-containing protein [Dactylosporangium sp.]NNJ61231.1 DUF397 domain-containing protein [Dactylosporangium sp.]